MSELLRRNGQDRKDKGCRAFSWQSAQIQHFVNANVQSFAPQCACWNGGHRFNTLDVTVQSVCTTVCVLKWRAQIQHFVNASVQSFAPQCACWNGMHRFNDVTVQSVCTTVCVLKWRAQIQHFVNANVQSVCTTVCVLKWRAQIQHFVNANVQSFAPQCVYWNGEHGCGWWSRFIHRGKNDITWCESSVIWPDRDARCHVLMVVLCTTTITHDTRHLGQITWRQCNLRIHFETVTTSVLDMYQYCASIVLTSQLCICSDQVHETICLTQAVGIWPSHVSDARRGSFTSHTYTSYLPPCLPSIRTGLPLTLMAKSLPNLAPLSPALSGVNGIRQDVCFSCFSSIQYHHIHVCIQ